MNDDRGYYASIREWIKRENEAGRKVPVVVHVDMQLDKPPPEFADLDIEWIGANWIETTCKLVLEENPENPDLPVIVVDADDED